MIETKYGHRGEAQFNPETIKRMLILHQLETQTFNPNPVDFKASMDLSHHPLMLTQYSVEDLRQLCLFKLKDFNIGFGLKDKGLGISEIVAVHNNEFDVSNLGTDIIRSAIKLGGNALDHFGSGKLNQLYSSMGFVEVRRVEYDPEYDPEGKFRNRYGRLPVIYRVHQDFLNANPNLKFD